MSRATTSTPATSRPTILAASIAAGGDLGMDQIGHVGRGAAGAQIALRRMITCCPAAGIDSGV